MSEGKDVVSLLLVLAASLFAVCSIRLANMDAPDLALGFSSDFCAGMLVGASTGMVVVAVIRLLRDGR